MWPFDGRARTLTGLTGPTRVRLAGEILAGSNWTSPFSNVPALLFGWSFFRSSLVGFVHPRLNDRMGGRASDEPLLQLIGADAWSPEPLRIGVDGLVVVVPIASPKVRFRNPEHAAARVECDWPPYLNALPRGNGDALYFTERTLIAGDRVELTATVEPAAASAGGYRSAAMDPFVVRTDLERVSLVET